MSKTPSLTVKIPRGYNHAPYTEEFVDPVLGNYILRVAITCEPATDTVVDVDLYHKDTDTFLNPTSLEMDDCSVSAWFHLPKSQQDVYVEIFPETTVVSLWE